MSFLFYHRLRSAIHSVRKGSGNSQSWNSVSDSEMTPVKLFPQWKTLLLVMHKIPLSGSADAKGYLDSDSQFKSRCHPFMRMNDSHFLAQLPSLASSTMTRCFLWEWKWPSNASYPRLWVNVERFQSSFAFVFFPFHFFRNGWQGCFEDWHMHWYCCHEMPPVFEMHFPTSRGSNFELDPVQMFLVSQGKKFGPCNCSV